jgi:hypothetical protein
MTEGARIETDPDYAVAHDAVAGPKRLRGAGVWAATPSRLSAIVCAGKAARRSGGDESPSEARSHFQ